MEPKNVNGMGVNWLGKDPRQLNHCRVSWQILEDYFTYSSRIKLRNLEENMIFLLVVMVFFEFDFVFIVALRQGLSMYRWPAYHLLYKPHW